MARNAFALGGSVTLSVFASSSRDVLGLAERTDGVHAAVAARPPGGCRTVGSADRYTVAKARRAPGGTTAREVGLRHAAIGHWPALDLHQREGADGTGRVVTVEIRARSDRGDRSRGADWWIDGDDEALRTAVEGHGFRFEESRPVTAAQLAPPPTSCAVAPPREGKYPAEPGPPRSAGSPFASRAAGRTGGGEPVV